MLNNTCGSQSNLLEAFSVFVARSCPSFLWLLVASCRECWKAYRLHYFLLFCWLTSALQKKPAVVFSRVLQPLGGSVGLQAGEERHFHSLREREMGMSYCNLQRGGRHETLWRSTYRPLKCFFQPLSLFSFFWFPEHSVPTVLVLSSRCSQHFSLLLLCRALCSSLRRCFPVTFRKKQSSRRGVSSSRTTEKENHLLSLLSSSAAY